MVQKEQKKMYEAPMLAIMKVEMEQGIAACSSATFTPQVEDWQIEDQSQDISI